MRWQFIAIHGAAALLLAAGAARAQETGRLDLADAVRSAAANLRPVEAADVSQARQELKRQLNQLNAFLSTGAPQKATGWKRYLQWDELLRLASSDQPGAADATQPLFAKLRANTNGLERPEFMTVRDALAAYASVSAAAGNAKLKDEYAQRMENLATALDVYAKDSSNGDAALTIGRTIGWLDAHRQSPELVRAIRRAAGQPNFFGQASLRFASAGIERDINQLSAINDNILGTSMHGSARLIGHTTMSLVENPNAASMNILLGGNAWSNNVGYNGPVTIHSTGVTSISGKKSIWMDAEGMHGSMAQAWCGTRSNINDICARCGLIEKVAWKRAGQQQGQGEAIASQHASSRVASQMDYEAGRLVKEQNDRYLQKFRNPLLRKGEFPEELNFSTTRDRLQVRMLQESHSLLAAPDQPPGHTADRDIAVRAHESAIIAYAEGVLPDYNLTDVELERMIRDDLKAEVPDELRVTLPDGTKDLDKEPWAIKFAQELPFRAKFNNNTVWMAIRVGTFFRGQDTLDGPYKPAIRELVEISALYNIERTDVGATLRREGDVVIRFPNRANPDERLGRDTLNVPVLRRKFRSLFKEEFVGQGLKLKGEWAKAGTLTLQEVQADKAWLTLGWNMASSTSAAAPAAGGGE